MKNAQYALIVTLLFLWTSCHKNQDTTPSTPPVAAFVVDTATPIVGEPITFTNQSQNATSYDWNFNDGDRSSAINPTHTYQEVGTYDVKLIASNGDLEDVIQKKVAVKAPVNIFPGIRIRDIKPGDTWAEVKDLADYHFTFVSSTEVNPTYFAYQVRDQSIGLVLFLVGEGSTIQDSALISTILALSPFIGTTVEEIGLGSTLEELLSTYGDPQNIINNTYVYSSLKISFSIIDSEVSALYIP